MKLENSTNFENEMVREIIRFVKPNGISNFDVMLKNCKYNDTARGRAYAHGSSYHASSSPFVVVSIGKDTGGYPRIKDIGKAYLPVLLLSREEELVKVMAHELRHLWQAKHSRGYRVWGAKGKFSERDADAYAIRKVREWRKLQRVN